MSDMTVGVIFGNRDFFPDQLVGEARTEVKKILDQNQVKSIILNTSETKLGGVESYADAQKCAQLFSNNRDSIQGILVILPNFGDEKGVVDTIKLSGLNVPILVQAYPDDMEKMNPALRRDGYCGKISVCNNLKQRGIPYSLTTKHVISPSDPVFISDLQKFFGICRVVNGLRNARVGAIGARPGAFNTVRYSEKILDANGISVTTVDFSEILGNTQRLDNKDPRVKVKLDEVKAYADATSVPDESMVKIAKMGIVLDEFMEENGLHTSAIQCWTSLQENYGINVCTNMSMMSNGMLPSACEVDVMGALSMYALQLASGSPSALADWNNNYGGEKDKCVMFHCGNWPKNLVENIQISNAPILGSSIGIENTYGAMEGRTPAASLTYGRLSTDDVSGSIIAYVGEGQFTDDALNTFGMRAVAHIPEMEKLLNHICENGFEHHVAMNMSYTADILNEAFTKYLGWEVYYHK
jgi:L-fucose isomerase-like protein